MAQKSVARTNFNQIDIQGRFPDSRKAKRFEDKRENILYSWKNFLFLCAASHDKRENVLPDSQSRGGFLSDPNVPDTIHLIRHSTVNTVESFPFLVCCIRDCS